LTTKKPLPLKLRAWKPLTWTPSALLIWTPFCAGAPRRPRPSSFTFSGFLESPISFTRSFVGLRIRRPSLYVPLPTRIVVPLPAASIAAWIFLYLQPFLQTFSVPPRGGFFGPLPGSLAGG
jgi:hypothetical protein